MREDVDGVSEKLLGGGKEVEEENDVFAYGGLPVEYREVGRGKLEVL